MTATLERPSEAPARADYSAPNSIPIDLIDPSPYNPREHYDQERLQSLADDIRLRGLLQPIIVRRLLDRYEILDGERRYRACKLVNEEFVPALVRDCDDAQAIEISVVANLQREGLNPIEIARGIERMSGFGMTQVTIAERLGRQQGDVSKLLGLLKLPEQTRRAIAHGELTQTHGVYLGALLEWPERIVGMTALAIEGKWSTDTLKSRVDDTRSIAEASRGQVKMFDEQGDAPASEPTKEQAAANTAVNSFFDAKPAQPPAAGPPPGTVTSTDRVTETHTTVTTPAAPPPAPPLAAATPPSSVTSTPAPAARTDPPAATVATPAPTGALVGCSIPQALDDWLWDQEMSVIEALELLRRMQTALQACGHSGDLKAFAEELEAAPGPADVAFDAAEALEDEPRDMSIYDPPELSAAYTDGDEGEDADDE